MYNRRDFLKLSVKAGGAALLASRCKNAFAQFTHTQRLKKFIQPLARFGAEIPISMPDTTMFPGTDFYSFRLGEYSQQLHPDLPKATRLWGYADDRHFPAPWGSHHRARGTACEA